LSADPNEGVSTLSQQNARYIWNDPEGRGRNRYVLFRKSFDLPGEPRSGELNLFADTRYRLIVNGVTLGHGPARFFLPKPEYDTFDLTPHLRRGANTIAIAVNSYGCVSFHNVKSIGGLIAWGEASDDAGDVLTLDSDASWRAIESPGHQRETHYLSFALNPAEQLDARKMPEGWELPGFDDSAWPPAVLQAHPEHWGALAARSIPPLDESEITPPRRLSTWVARDLPGEDIHSLMLTTREGESLHTQAQVAVMTFLHSPRKQRITFGAWWGRYWMNGQELKGTPREDVGLRQDFSAELEEGWNTLLVFESVRSDWWDFHLALPADAEVSISAERQVDSPNVFLVGGPWEGASMHEARDMDLPLTAPEDLPESLGPWTPWSRGRKADMPVREREWKVFELIPDDSSVLADVPKLSEHVGDNTLVLLYDFEDEVLGRPVLEFSAAAGTVVDVTYSERLDADGKSIVQPRHLVDMVERYVAREGGQRWQTFHPRGFRYMEVLIRGDLGKFSLEKVALTRANYPVREIGQFECSDPLLNDIWKLGRATLYACMEDAYLDCPWRERGLYSGDFLVQFHTNLATYGDTDLFRRCIELFLLAQGENGLVPAGAHGLPAGRHPDYSAIIPQTLWCYWTRTGDVDFLRQMEPRLHRLLDGLWALRRGDDVLLDGSDLQPYIDLSHMDRGGINCALNCFYESGFRHGAKVLDLLGEPDEAEKWRTRANGLAEAIRREFWSEEHNAFVDRLRSDVPETEPSVPANALPLLFDIADERQKAGAISYVEAAMAKNFRVAEPEGNDDCNVTGYFSYYALGVLYRFGKVAQAEQFIRTYWGRMLEQGAWTCWEFLVDRASRCHAWSSSPTHYLSTQVLGVRLPDRADAGTVEIHPNPGTLTWARGVYPHPSGPIRVEWRIEDGKLCVDYDAPEGVEVAVTIPEM
jgi:alpha-L-rhamnosidase